MLKKGFRWVVGDGESINIFTYVWLREKRIFYVENIYEPDIGARKNEPPVHPQFESKGRWVH